MALGLRLLLTSLLCGSTSKKRFIGRARDGQASTPFSFLARRCSSASGGEISSKRFPANSCAGAPRKFENELIHEVCCLCHHSRRCAHFPFSSSAMTKIPSSLVLSC